jgi:hypothetical protein
VQLPEVMTRAPAPSAAALKAECAADFLRLRVPSRGVCQALMAFINSSKHAICSLIGTWGFYQGETDGCKCHGDGVVRFHSGDITRGQFSNHCVNGLAVTVCADGTCISGMHRDGKLHGPGVLTNADGTLVHGNWLDGSYCGPNPDALNVAIQAEKIAAGISLRLSNRNSFVGSGIGKIFQALGCISLVASVSSPALCLRALCRCFSAFLVLIRCRYYCPATSSCSFHCFSC